MSRVPSPRDDEEAPKDCISPNPDVFSYFMLAAPSERKKHNRFTVDAGMSYFLVVLTLVIQGILLYCVYNKVIYKNLSWQHGILNTGKDWNLLGSGTGKDGCNDGGSLCTLQNGIYSCAPPSVQLIGRWDELDLNQDGVWSMDEVRESRESLKCKYAVDPVEVFGVLITLLKERSQIIWLNQDVNKSAGIQKAYFTYIMGDVAMCGYRNTDMCGNLLQRGVFDAPLRNVSIPRVGGTIKSALDYCHELLDQGGLCERLLPSTYSTWKIESVQECQEAEYNKFVYTDPSDNSFKSLLTVDYQARQDYETARTNVFRSYKYCIVFIWLLLIVSRLREVGKAMAWVHSLPTTVNEEQEAIDSARGDVDHVRYMSNTHRFSLYTMVFLRMFLLLVLLYVGLNFLGRQTAYIDLLLDGVALMFIVEVAEILYGRILREDVKTTWQAREPMEIPDEAKFSRLVSRPDIEDVVFLVFVAVATLLFMVYHNKTMVEPVYQSLQCACLGEGDNCAEATKFSREFWSNYWSKDVPGSITAIQSLEAAAAGSASHAGRAAVNLLKRHSQVHFH